ncbi:hypothetical protein [Paraburkholderia youngii]|uniref:hypothetical protein n=1 Tax=Paraburkholderia youngii TaxID=2782701 RepID=UPI003D229C29
MPNFQQDEQQDQRDMLPNRMVVQDVRRKLLRLLDDPRLARGAATEAIRALHRTSKTMMAVDAAILGIEDEAARRRLAEVVLCEEDAGRVAMVPMRTDVCILAMGAFFEGEVPSEDPVELRRIVCGQNESYLRAPCDDPLRADTPGLILVVPAYNLRIMELGLYTSVLGLGDPHIPGSNLLYDGWNTPDCPSVLFTFALAPEDCDRTDDRDWKFSGTYYAGCVEAINARVAAVNAAYPAAKLKVFPPARFSQALQPVHEAALATTVERDFRALEAGYHAYLSDKSPEERQSMDPEGMKWKGFTCAYVSTTTWVDEMIQTVDILFVNDEVPSAPAYPVRYRISPLSTVESVCSAIAPVLAALNLETRGMPPAVAPGPWDATADGGKFRDVDGRWLPQSLLSQPYEARSLIKSETWRMTLNAESEAEFDEMARWPFPFLYRNIDVPKLLRDHFREDVCSKISSLCAQPGLSYTQAQARILERFPGYKWLQSPPSRDRQELLPELDVPYELYLSQHFRKCDGRIFHIRNALVERLDFSDIENGVPVSYLKAPFPDCYLHLEKPLVFFSGEGRMRDESRVVGYFVTQHELDGPVPGWRLAIAMIVTLGPDMLTAYSQEIELELRSDDSRGLLEAINDLIAARAQNHRLTLHDPSYQTVNLCAKILLYLGLRSARLVNRPERTKLLEQSKNRSASERKRIAQRATDLYDYIEVGPERTMAQEHSDAVREGRKVFWRRGYFRNQAYGPNWSLHRLRHIRETLVNADQLSGGDEPPPVKDYRVGPAA